MRRKTTTLEVRQHAEKNNNNNSNRIKVTDSRVSSFIFYKMLYLLEINSPSLLELPMKNINKIKRKIVRIFIPLHEKFLQFDWLRAVVFQLNLKFLHVKITTLLWVVV